MNTAVTVVAGAALGPRPLLATYAYFLAFIAQGMVGAVLAPTLPGLVAQTGAPLSAISLLFAMRALGGLAGAAQGGRLYDRLPGHPVMALALLAAAVLMALLPLAYGLWFLVALVTLLGSATGVLNLGGNTLLAWVQRERLAPYMNALHFCFGLGAFLSPLLVAGLMGPGGDSALALWVLALLLLPVAGLLLWIPSPASLARQGSGGEVAVDHRLVVLFVVFFCGYVGAEVSFGSLIYSYAVEQQLLDAAGGALLTGAFWG
ncbi:MAG: MFS transporter, partial [Candidatus Competibacteraceae bacterium]|nr:MFS transporter [Candidatus Competibacteraceae bacterium]